MLSTNLQVSLRIKQRSGNYARFQSYWESVVIGGATEWEILSVEIQCYTSTSTLHSVEQNESVQKNNQST